MTITLANTCWEAVLHRDARADGRFVFAVRTTGIYCRPTCPARRPHRANVQFFFTPREAEQAGFRACKRCHPQGATLWQQRLERMQALLDQPESPPNLGQLAQEMRLSPWYLQRMFLRYTGLTPRQYVNQRRTERFHRAVDQGLKVTQAVYAAGYDSSQAYYRLAAQQPGGSRGVARQAIRYTCQSSLLGLLCLAATQQGLSWLSIEPDFPQALQRLQNHFAGLPLLDDAVFMAPYLRAIQAYLAGQSLPALPLDMGGTPFQQQVWQALQQIPPGQTRSYQEVAVLLGRPRAFRAVAQACARNPVALVVPCHRVIQTGGGLGGYAYGLPIKRFLLDLEKAAYWMASSIFQ